MWRGAGRSSICAGIRTAEGEPRGSRNLLRHALPPHVCTPALNEMITPTQKTHFRANWMNLGSLVARIFPNEAPAARLFCGLRKLTLLNKLKYSFRNWILPQVSEMVKSLKIAKSWLMIPGPRIVFRPTLPKVPSAATRKALILKYCSMRSPFGRPLSR